jgi:hypothetical protein
MSTNPVDANFVTRFLLGFAVIAAMTVGGRAVGSAFVSVGIPYGEWLGVAVGAMLVFAVFAVLYRRYDAAFDAD